ncbi:MAG: hypothetical protein ACFFEL_12595 [Candidatus Thorarchaeota archaeon]
MIQLLEIAADQAIIIATAIPIVTACLFILIIPWLRKGSQTRMRRYLSYLVKPPRIGPLNSQDPNIELRSNSLWREIKVRLFFVYLAIGLFLACFMISELYEVIFDITLPVSQGSTGEMRTVSSVAFMSIFNAGWIGALPWYGHLPAPSILGTYHDSWGWIFFTSAITDNPNFFTTMVFILLLMSFASGLVFMAPLISKTIRESFLPSMFFYMTSLLVFTKAAIGASAQVLSLLLGGSIRYGLWTITGEMIPRLYEGLLYGLPILLAMFSLFMFLGRKLWQVHYSDLKSKRWFMVFVTLIFWLSLFISMSGI